MVVVVVDMRVNMQNSKPKNGKKMWCNLKPTFKGKKKNETPLSAELLLNAKIHKWMMSEHLQMPYLLECRPTLFALRWIPKLAQIQRCGLPAAVASHKTRAVARNPLEASAWGGGGDVISQGTGRCPCRYHAAVHARGLIQIDMLDEGRSYFLL